MRAPSLLLTLCAATSCGGGSSPNADAPAGDAPPQDGAPTVDAPAIDAPMTMGSATWTLVGQGTACTATVAPVCIDVGVQGGYQFSAGAPCPLNNNLTIYLPGGAVPAAGTYTVKPVVNLYVDILNLTAGQIAVRSVFHPNGSTQEEWLAQGGTVTVTNTGGKVGYTAVNLPMKKLGTAITTTLSATASCP